LSRINPEILERIKAGGKPVSFDLWRKHYRQLTFRQQVDIYNAWALRYPNQGSHYCLPAVLKAIEEVKQKLNKNVLRIIELGGYQGELAFDVLTCYPNFIYVNYDFCSIAIQRTKPKLKGYKFWNVRLKKPFWQIPIQKYDLFITSHTLEHMINEEVFKILNHIKQTPFIYVQMPIRHIGYDGVGAGHICSLSWLQIEKHLNSLGYKNVEMEYLKRWEARMCSRYQNYTEIIKVLQYDI